MNFKNVSRRDVNKTLFAMVAATVAYPVLSQAPSSLLDRVELLPEIHEHNVSIKRTFGIFTRDELEDILFVLNKYNEELGDLRKYNFVIGREFKDPNLVIEQSIKGRYEHCKEYRGYRVFGRMNENKHYSVSLASKKGIEGATKYLQKRGALPKGEEKSPMDFRWVLAHELGHSLAYKTDINKIVRNGYGVKRNDFFRDWWKLWNERIDHGSRSKENVRPEGYPRRRAYLEHGGTQNSELFADLAAYYITGSNYADHDPLLMKGVDVVRTEFQRIKEVNLKN